MTRARLMLTLAGAIAGGVLVWWTFQSNFAAPISQARDEAAALEVRIGELQNDIAQGKKIRRELNDAAITMLGRDAETVVHRLRVALSTIGERAGLHAVVVDSRPRGSVESPAAGAFKSDRSLRDRVDFSVVEGTLRGRGTTAQVMEALGAVESQAWPKRIKSMSIEPGKDHTEIAVTLDTVYFDDLPSKPSDEPPAIAQIDPEHAEMVERIVSKNVFERPKPVQTPESPPAPSGSPVGEWVVTGWAEGASGWELWLRCMRDQQTRVVPAGQTLFDVTFVGVKDGVAVIEIAGQRYAIGLGQSLGTTDRRIE